MAEYFEREATIKRIQEAYCADCNSYNGVRCRACGTGDAIDMIEDATAADVAPVVHGQWEQDADGDWYCTNCNEVVAICESGRERTYRKPYCPNCGAKMNRGAGHGA